MKSDTIKTKIFLDAGNPEETKEIIRLLGFLDGQTTNPTLIAKNPKAQEKLAAGEKFSKEEVWDFYKKTAQEISNIIPKGDISLEVYADRVTSAEHMLSQAREMFSWIINGRIKFPITQEGLKAAQAATKKGLRINMTLCFSQEQAAAVYSATRGAKKGQVVISPFIGRLDDQGENGMDLIKHVITMYQQGDGHVEVLTASVRNLDHFLCALKLGSHIITAPSKILKDWASGGMLLPKEDFAYPIGNLKHIPYQKLDLNQDWKAMDINHQLTDIGVDRFSSDWNSIIAQ